MAKAYRALADVSIPRPIAKISGEGDEAQYETTGANYPAGSFVRADQMTPHDRKMAESGELSHLLQPLSDEDASEVESYGDSEPTWGVFIAEHEAEAHALAQAGHVVVPEDQALEALSASSEHHAQYQQAVKEHGLDRRPVQEAMLKHQRQRVPDHVLYGAETRTGTPHNRGPAEQEPEGDYDEQEGSESSTEAESAPRPRPGAGSDQSAQEAAAEQSAEAHAQGSAGEGQ